MTDDRVDTLARSLRETLDEPQLIVRPWRAGADFWADLVEMDSVLAVVRSPRTELADTSYDGVVDFGAVIEKEVIALQLMAAEYIPVPRVLGWRRATKVDEPSWILLSYVAHDENADIPLDRLGELARQIHGIRPSTSELGPQPSWSDFIWDRLRQRLSAARTYLALPDDSVLEKRLIELLETRGPHATSLLHMDLRSTNVCVKDGHIAALIDVANCIVGDPLMELGRIRGYGLLNGAFRAGYGLDHFSPAESALLDIYELDTALLLTVVSVEEFDDPVLHHDQSARATHLAARIAKSL
jgi:aminoglycoside phosphotransferase (APT) family kinase protein